MYIISACKVLIICHVYYASKMHSAERMISYGIKRLSIEQLNGKQREAVVSFVEGKDVLVSLPMGFGKSICFQILPFVLDYMSSPSPGEVVDKYIALIIKPTAAIMCDQVSRLVSVGYISRFYKPRAKRHQHKTCCCARKIRVCVYIPGIAVTSKIQGNAVIPTSTKMCLLLMKHTVF